MSAGWKSSAGGVLGPVGREGLGQRSFECQAKGFGVFPEARGAGALELFRARSGQTCGCKHGSSSLQDSLQGGAREAGGRAVSSPSRLSALGAATVSLFASGVSKLLAGGGLQTCGLPGGSLVGVHVCAYVYMYVCMHKHVYVRRCVCVYMCMCACVSVYVHVCMCMCAHMHVCVSVHVCMYVCVCACICAYVHVHVCMCTCMHALCTCACVYVCMCVCPMYMCIYVRACMCVFVHVCAMGGKGSGRVPAD